MRKEEAVGREDGRRLEKVEELKKRLQVEERGLEKVEDRRSWR